MSANRSQQGLTLIELLVVMAISAIAFMLAVPGLQSMISNAQGSALLMELSASLRFARTEAVKQSLTVTVCPSSSGEACREGKHPEWNAGWMLFADQSGNGWLDSSDEILRVHQFSNPQYSLIGLGGLRQRTRFFPTGFPDKPGSLEYCDLNDGKAYSIKLSGTGRRSVEPAEVCSGDPQDPS